jgi:hypothetical protein
MNELYALAIACVSDRLMLVEVERLAESAPRSFPTWKDKVNAMV